MQRDTNDKSDKKKNNSLEYYNDDMPRKAVGKLFSAFDEEEPKTTEEAPVEVDEDKDIVSGYDNGGKDVDYYETVEPRRRKKSFDEPREARASRSRSLSPEQEPKRERYEFIEESEVRGDRAKSGDNYDFGMYRKKDKKSASSRPTSKRKSLYDDEDDDDDKPAKKYFATAPIPIQNSRPKPKPADTAESIMKKSQSARFFDNDYADDDDDDSPLILTSPGTLKIIAASVCVLFLIILAMLIVKLNIVSAKVKTYEEQLADYNTTKESFSALQMQYDAAQKKISDLEGRVGSGDSDGESTNPSSGIDIDSPDTPSLNTSGSAGSEDSSSSTASSSSASSSGKKYTIKPGDTLMKIAGEQMGDSSRYREIMEANGISTDLQVGQEITIPQP